MLRTVERQKELLFGRHHGHYGSLPYLQPILLLRASIGSFNQRAAGFFVFLIHVFSPLPKGSPENGDPEGDWVVT